MDWLLLIAFLVLLVISGAGGFALYSFAGKIKREKDHAQAVYERNYRKEHSEGG